MFEPICIAEAASQIRSGRIAPSGLLERCLEQIRKYEHRVRAWVVVDEEGARRAAETLDREAPRGPLYGIPLGIKDIVDVAGLPTRAGSPLRENHLARSDAPVVGALRQAGAVILGKTVTVEFACFDPSPTRNPWDPTLQHTPGGSSSGSAVAVALGMCLGAIGTQTGGSLVRPASYCGIATCKPTFGRLDTQGIIPVSDHLDHPGPMAHTVGDLELLLQCLLQQGRGTRGEGRGKAEAGRRTSPSPLPPGPRPHAPRPSRSPPPRLGLLEHSFMEQADQPVREVTHAALAKLCDHGAQIEPVTFPDGFEQVQPMHRRIMAVEAAAYHREQFAARREAYGPKITALLDEGLAVSGVDYAAALAWQRHFRRRIDILFGSSATLDALVMPSTDTTAPATLETTGTPKFQAPWSCAGVPVVSIPSGLASDGMPAGLQLVGPRDQDARLLQVARWCERCLTFDDLPPLLR